MTTIGKFICALIMIGSFAACTKNELNISESTRLDESKAQTKIFFVSAYKANPFYQISINDVRVSNTLGGGTAAPTPFPGGGLNSGGSTTPDYMGVPAGLVKVGFAIPKFQTNTDSVTLSSNTLTLTSGKKYSLYVTDTAANTSYVLVEDTLVRSDSGYAKYKFVNLVPDKGAVDLYVGTTIVATNVPYKGVSASFILPTSNASATWTIKATGTSTTIGGGYAGTVANTIANQRIYTVIARGYGSITSTSDPRYSKISLIINQ
jgi:hypothetical protein